MPFCHVSLQQARSRPRRPRGTPCVSHSSDTSYAILPRLSAAGTIASASATVADGWTPPSYPKVGHRAASSHHPPRMEPVMEPVRVTDDDGWAPPSDSPDPPQQRGSAFRGQDRTGRWSEDRRRRGGGASRSIDRDGSMVVRIESRGRASSSSSSSSSYCPEPRGNPTGGRETNGASSCRRHATGSCGRDGEHGTSSSRPRPSRPHAKRRSRPPPPPRLCSSRLRCFFVLFNCHRRRVTAMPPPPDGRRDGRPGLRDERAALYQGAETEGDEHHGRRLQEGRRSGRTRATDRRGTVTWTVAWPSYRRSGPPPCSRRELCDHRGTAS